MVFEEWSGEVGARNSNLLKEKILNCAFENWGNRATTQTHIWNCNIFPILEHCVYTYSKNIIYNTYVWKIPNCTNFSFKHLRHSNVAHRHSGSSRHIGLSWKFANSSSKALRQSEHNENPITGLLFSSDFLHIKQLLITNSGNSI